MAVAYTLFWTGKKYVTLPRMGMVRFGAERKRRKFIMILILSVVVLIQVILFLFTLMVWANPEWNARFIVLLPDKNVMDLIVASIGALFVGPSMILVAYFKDFQRGYFIAVMIALAVFLMIFLNQPIYPIIIGILIALPGCFLFVRFLAKYPLHKNEVTHD
jgi:Flp pilus assembly protein TadB